MMDDRAATETLGFILAFALITASIGLIYTSGFGGLQDTRNAEQIQNVERAFEVMAENLEDVRRYGTPSRSTEIRLLDGDLVLGNQTHLVVNISGATNPVVSTNMRPIVFESGHSDTQIAYEGGALFRSDGNASLMYSQPGWLLSDSQLVLPMVGTYRQDGPNELNVRGTALVVAQSVNSTIVQRENTSLNVTVTVESPRADAWSRYLDEKGFTPVDTDTSDGDVVYTVDVQRVYLPTAIIGLELSR